MPAPANFKGTTPELDKMYRDHFAVISKIVKAKARRWAYRGAGEYDDLVQEGLLDALWLLNEWDGKRPFQTYLSYVLDREMEGLKSRAMRPKRNVHMMVVDPQTGKKRMKVFHTLSLAGLARNDDGEDCDFDPPSDYDWSDPSWAMRRESEQEWAKIWILRLRPLLTSRQKKVLRVMINPKWDLLAMVRNLTGGYEVSRKHMADYLGLTKSQVEYDAGQIRRLLLELMDEYGVSSYAEAVE